MKVFTLCSIGVLALATAISPALASQLAYTPVNPTFGGNPLNGTFLLGTAQGQGFDVDVGSLEVLVLHVVYKIEP